jgi:hypothetical protein
MAESPSAEDVKTLYTAKLNTYRAFISFFRSRKGIRALLESSELVRPRFRVLDAGAGFGTVTFALLDALSQRCIEPHVIDAFDGSSPARQRPGTWAIPGILERL